MSDVLVLCYHAVSSSWEAELSVTPDDLERQVAFLLGRGWQAATFCEAALNPSAPRTVAITFDDAFASVRDYAAPILSALGVPATVFAPTMYLATGSLTWPGIEHWKDAPPAYELNAMSWEDLGGLKELGWEIGSHTRSHPHLTQLDDDTLNDELEGSRSDCARELGCSCQTIAYPYGDVDVRVARKAKQVGYLAGASLSGRLERLGPYRHPRVGVYHKDGRWRFRLKAAPLMRELRASRGWRRGS